MLNKYDPPDPIRPDVSQQGRQLFIDLDGVLADLDRFYKQQFGVSLDRGIPNDPPGMWENISGHGRFYADLPVMADALELWEGAKRLHSNPIILTGCPHSVPNVEDHKREWVRRHIGPDATVITCKSKDKRLHAKRGDVLIDDWHKYRPLWEEMGGIFILHTSATTSLAQASGLFNGLALASASASPGSGEGWRLIESAPKDTALLLWTGWSYQLGHFNTSLNRWAAGWDGRPIEVTHWQPLPASPSALPASTPRCSPDRVIDCECPTCSTALSALPASEGQEPPATPEADQCGVAEVPEHFSYECTLPKGHDGPHIAHGGNRIELHRWASSALVARTEGETS